MDRMAGIDIIDQKRTAHVVVEPIDCPAPPGGLVEALDRQPDPVMLDSSALDDEYGRYSVLTCAPIEVLTLREGVLTNRSGRVLGREDETIWQALEAAFSGIVLRPPLSAHERPGYLPGWFGYLGYELGRHVEKLPGRAVRDTALPDIRLGLHDAIALYDALTEQWSLVELVFDAPPRGAGRARRFLREMLTSPSRQAEPRPLPAYYADARAGRLAWAEPNFAPEEYRQAVARCVDYIAAGDIFQVNLSQRLTVREVPDPPVVYRALRRRNPAWYAAYLRFAAAGHDCSILSSSPELFLRLRGKDVLTRPIKGTRPRTGDPQADEAAAAELRGSEKDNAELAMIVDLLRNDLGRVCRFGSVRVTDRRRLETHPTVFHLVGTVTGRLVEDVGPAGLLRACFPGGSITGAPKIRAMEIIDELEPTARSVYTGAIGTVAVDGWGEWNIVIRTMICQDRTCHLQVGGGIVADSTPDREYQETLDKARAMLEAIECARGVRTTRS